MGGGSHDGKITMSTLKRVAKLLKEDVDDEVLKNMLLEANGGAGLGKGVDVEEFEGVMRRGKRFSREQTANTDVSFQLGSSGHDQ